MNRSKIKLTKRKERREVEKIKYLHKMEVEWGTIKKFQQKLKPKQFYVTKMNMTMVC